LGLSAETRPVDKLKFCIEQAIISNEGKNKGKEIMIARYGNLDLGSGARQIVR
jgi:hypothetical protein